jgi:hypothetical protein
MSRGVGSVAIASLALFAIGFVVVASLGDRHAIARCLIVGRPPFAQRRCALTGDSSCEVARGTGTRRADRHAAQPYLLSLSRS